MLDGPWHRDVPRSLPPRWGPKVTPAARTVYLDQWCYNHLADDRAGKPRQPDEAGCFEFFRSLAHAGSVVFVLSRTHYLENGVRNAVDARWRTAVAMAELSGFNSITAAGLVEWDTAVAVARSVGRDAEVPPPNVFGWGVHHCFFGQEPPEDPKDDWTVWGQVPAFVHTLPPDLITKVHVECELAQLAMWHPSRWPDTTSTPTLPRDVAGDLLVEEAEQDEAHFARLQSDYPRTPAMVRAVMEARFLLTPEWRHVQNACEHLRVPLQTILPGLGQDPGDDARVVKRNRKALRAFIASMPIQGRFSELRVQSHLQQGRKRRPSDALDYFQIASVSPFVDYMVVDAHMADQVRKGGLDARPGAMFVASLAALRHQLANDVGA
ncbi:hypothetical protein LO763_20210 [Glycomyces sp. A-F 0318]|uniref:hypothetical protein n=1 Tax=Glycomyces amatae TaxID=2881355 RepID=UPI001E56292C|nr:hypothetical protein [Glycomyces amatae]MCD0445939.1 hypothetical protein [Glycomyces amatae]